MRPSDIGLLASVGAPAVSPDGTQVAYPVTRTDLDANKYRTAIWVAATDGGSPPRQMTSGEHGDDEPAWSPDGRWLAFTSSRKEDKGGTRSTLHLLPVDGPGETVTLADRDESIADLRWSPDGARLAFTSRVRAERLAEDDEAAQPPRHITRLFSRLDSVGWTIDRPNQVFVVPVDGSSAAVQITTAERDHGDPDWRPDGLALVCSAQADGADLTARTDLFLVGLQEDGLCAAGEPERLTPDEEVSYGAPAWSPDGSRIACLTEHATVWPGQPQIEVLDVATGEHHEVARSLDRSCFPFPGRRRPVWDGDSLLFSIEDRGAVHVYRVPADATAPPARVIGGERWVTGFDLAGGTLVASVSTMTEVPDVYVAAGGLAAGGSGEAELRRLSTVGASVHRRVPPIAAEHFVVDSPAGDGDLDAWLIRPGAAGASGRSGGTKVPVLLNIHGGPMTQYGHRFFDEFQVYAGAGYAVLFCNIHGSSGDTEARLRSIRSPKAAEEPGSGWGGVDYEDLMAVVDAALERFDFLDADRMGVMGGSYGGYMTSWIVGHTDRFAAACSERAVNNMLTLETSSDVAGWFRFEIGPSHLDDPEEYLRQSPITYVRDITTPVLILHSEQDLRCPIEQADQLYVALRLLGREVDYYRFPAESHELTRSGSPKHRVQRFEILLDWFGRHLQGAPAST
ncbi:MAG: S9 family peptidase [Actinobacteria bacterium]|nr:S9 family peptidase [Actinomycetota bacterium]